MLSWQTNFWIAYWLTKAGLIPIIVNNVPWTVPPVLSGLLYSGSWTGAAYQILATAMTIALYMPFVKINDSINEERAAKIAAGEDVGPSMKVKAQ
ncbi:hypothetical protein [Lacticaseibacillus camelliae]|nr:hypothetical protein [Lacticaseibacillus camelliae]